jgi:hypothetical protein
MGLLDDAIREHLDLKRRRGADPADVARMEQEALGPVRRDPAPGEAAAGEPPPAEHHSDEHPHELAPEERHDPPHGDPLLEQHAHNVEFGGAAAEPANSPAPESEPEQPEPESEAAHAAIVDQPTTEYHVEDHHDDEDEHDKPPHGAHEDVLEETPDFLQETPEHDRLWFEQRPPRDFDFDG